MIGSARTVLTGPNRHVQGTASMIGLETLCDGRLAQSGSQLVELIHAGQKREIPLLSGTVDCGRVSHWDHEGGNQNVGIEYQAHQALLAFRWVRLSWRTSRTASSIMLCSSSGSLSALRALMSWTVR